MRVLLAVGGAVLVATLTPASPAGQEHKESPSRWRRAVTLSAAASAQLAARVLAHPDLAQRERGHRLAAIRLTAVDTGAAGEAARTVVTAVLFDHTALEARRVVLDAATNRLLSNERLPGRPQRSEGELREAIAIVRRDAALARLLDAGGVLDGGFIVDDPRGSRRRVIQFKLMRGDRRALLRSILVDLTRGEIVSADR